mmetsp:Transcript_28617/g.39302  ORF Transcript_28617/g.39302 Transcript_28617/m.39302 type:complete len:163 (-) Transcript_28617:246-734(-)
MYLCPYSAHPSAQRAVAIAAQNSYFVTNWRTAEIVEVIYRGSFVKFVFQIGALFRIGGIRQLYALKPGDLLEDRILITNQSELEAIFAYIDQNDEDPEALQVLYFNPEDDFPQSSPTKTPIILNMEEEKVDLSSLKSKRPTPRKRFTIMRWMECFNWSSHRF